MYSGTTFRRSSGNVLGAHQKIDRVARRQLRALLPTGTFFPTIKNILHFEGNNGPDGIKRKSPARDEPWHYIDPSDHTDERLLGYIDDHIHNLARALQKNCRERAAFEAAWLAHAVVDALTPAHYFPLEATYEAVRGESGATRSSLTKKIIFPGDNRLQQVRNNWQVWGAGGLMTTHGLFEWGVATSISTSRFAGLVPSEDQSQAVADHGFRYQLKCAIDDVYGLSMYEKFQKTGWTTQLARQSKKVLVPLIIQMVMLAWLSACQTSCRGAP